MKAWRAERFGEPGDVLTLRDAELPPVPPGFIALQVSAAGVALPDVLMLQGRYPAVQSPPVSPGMEAVGTILAIGSGVTLSVGDKVMTTTAATRGWGGFAEQCLADASKAFPVPRGMGDAEAAGFSLPYKTAHMALVHRCRLNAGERLLVLGAAGSSGAAAIQLGKALGAEVIAVASSPDKLAFCTAQGADHVVDHRREDAAAAVDGLTGGAGVDVVFDPVGGELGRTAMRLVARHGRYGIVGFASGSWVELEAHTLLTANASAVGVFAGDMTRQESESTFAELTEMAERGSIRSLVSQTFAFDQVIEALAAQASGGFLGKLVVTVDPSAGG